MQTCVASTTSGKPASGSPRDDFTAVSLGAMYQAEFRSANSRIDYRDAGSERRARRISGCYREPRMGHGLSAGTRRVGGAIAVRRQPMRAFAGLAVICTEAATARRVIVRR